MLGVTREELEVIYHARGTLVASGGARGCQLGLCAEDLRVRLDSWKMTSPTSWDLFICAFPMTSLLKSFWLKRSQAFANSPWSMAWANSTGGLVAAASSPANCVLNTLASVLARLQMLYTGWQRSFLRASMFLCVLMDLKSLARSMSIGTESDARMASTSLVCSSMLQIIIFKVKWII
uniref:Uncharacterized protein n=1 Tax=Spironucleus salmonicida TaxID=348837 RepID=V6LDW5_9EUKA|eukprot:EST42473.1 Hypothetical protein SS50377_17779 [Spironucleus salmonicida]